MYLDARVLLCEHCGAPLPAPDDGGTVTCTYCQAVTHLRERPFGPRPLPPISSLTLNEQQAARFREQIPTAEESPYSLNNPPSDFQDLDGLDMSPATRERLHRAFLDTLRRCRKEDQAEGQHRLFWLTNRLNNLDQFNGETSRSIPYLQQASETLLDPGFRRLLLLALASIAVKTERIEEAEGWLAQPAEFPGELFFYDLYRSVRAAFELLRGNAAGALALTGASIEELPTVGEHIPLLCLRRTSALEALGRGDDAEAALLAGVDWLHRYNINTNGGDQISPEKQKICRENAFRWFAKKCTPSARNPGDVLAKIWDRLLARDQLPEREYWASAPLHEAQQEPPPPPERPARPHPKKSVEVPPQTTRPSMNLWVGAGAVVLVCLLCLLLFWER